MVKEKTHIHKSSRQLKSEPSCSMDLEMSTSTCYYELSGSIRLILYHFMQNCDMISDKNQKPSLRLPAAPSLQPSKVSSKL